MTRHYHIITCDSDQIMAEFINSGLVGIRPVLTKKPKKKENETEEQWFRRWVSNTVRMNWDILADVARIKEGDYVLLHTGGVIKGVFEVVGDPLVVQSLSHLLDGPNIDTETWSNNWDAVTRQIASHNPVWMIPIKPHSDLYFKEMSMDVVFNGIAKGRITSLPQRLRYEDKNKATKGLTENDFEIVLELFYNYSSSDNSLSQGGGSSTMVPLTLDHLTMDGYEKNLEAVIVHRIRSGTFSISGAQFLHSNVLNTVPLGYLKMADLLTWDEKNGRVINPWIWIWELKRDDLPRWNALKEEIKKLSNRASYLNMFFKANYGSFKVSGVVVAPSFSRDAINKFRELITPIGVMEELLLVKYHRTGQDVQFTLVAKV